jgi:hypothetical protein
MCVELTDGRKLKQNVTAGEGDAETKSWVIVEDEEEVAISDNEAAEAMYNTLATAADDTAEPEAEPEASAQG